MTKLNIAVLLSATAGVGFLLLGCNNATPPAPQAAASSEPVAAAMSAPKPVFSVNELMVMVVDHPGELLWDVEKKGHTPKTAEAWYQLEDHAVELASAGTVIQLGGIGPKDADWASQPEWRTSAEALTTAALGARLAAHNHDLPALIKANGNIIDACQACHAKFKPNIPTGGIFYHIRPGVLN
jgi:cytochrome c556